MGNKRRNEASSTAINRELFGGMRILVCYGKVTQGIKKVFKDVRQRIWIASNQPA